MSQTWPGGLRQLDELQGFDAMRAFLKAHWERGGRSSDELAALLNSLSRPADGRPLDPAHWQAWRDAVAKACSGEVEAAATAEVKPTMEPRQLGFFSDWYVVIVWPNGRKQRVDGFSSEAHARGWIAHDSAEWLANNKPR